MKLMYDDFNLCEQVVEINESSGSKKYFIRGIWSTIGEKNRNGRSYPLNLWEREVAKQQPILADGSINSLMEYKHPARSKVEPMGAVAKCTKLWIDGKYVMGEAVILDDNSHETNKLKSLIDAGIKISVSSRGLGSVGRGGVVTDFKLITYDIVPDPSDFNATMNGMCESHQLTNGIVEGLTFDAQGNEISENDSELLSENEKNDHVLDKFKTLFDDFQND